MHFQDPPHPATSAKAHPSGANAPAAPDSALEDDFALMQGLARRDTAALTKLYDRHSGVVYTLCLKILRDPGWAEDVMVDVFQELWAKADRFNAGRGTPIAYLLTLARSRSLDRLRAWGNRPASSLHENTEADARPHPAPDPHQAAVSSERRLIVVHALEQLDPKYREALEAAYFEGLSHTEIAAKLHKPVGTVKTYLRRGLIQLRDLLRNPDEEIRPKSED